MEFLGADEARDHFFRGPNRTLTYPKFLKPLFKSHLTILPLIISIPYYQRRNVKIYLLRSVLALNILNLNSEAEISWIVLQKTVLAAKNEIILKAFSIFVRVHF